jgi:hypothetical protein
MSESRDDMIAALKRVAVPVIRELGFKGSFPHFRRACGSRIDLLTFQFSQWGGQFVVEVGSFPASGQILAGRVIPPGEVRMRHLLSRLRLGASDEHSDHWFIFDGGDYDSVAESVIPYIRGPAVAWWSRSEPGAAAQGEGM